MPDRSARALLAVLCAVAAIGFVALLYSQAKEFYPPFSSMRSDERGTMILYETLSQSGVREVTRSMLPVDQTHIEDATILLIGASATAPELRDESKLKALVTLAERGNRVVLSVAAPTLSIRALQTLDTKALERRGVAFRWKPALSADRRNRSVQPPQLTFEAKDEWRALRQDAYRVRAIERHYVHGWLVLVADSDVFLNLHLAQHPDSAFLLTLLGPNHHVVFDESHLGIVETGTILGLARRYHLQGLFFGFLLFAAVFLWRNLSAFPPARTDEIPTPRTSDSSFTAFAHLLKRSLTSGQLLDHCVQERLHMETSGAKRQKIEAALAECREESDVVRRFQTVQDRLHAKQTVR